MLALRVAEHLDVNEHLLPCVFAGPAGPASDPLALEQVEEAFGDCVVVAVAAAARAAFEPRPIFDALLQDLKQSSKLFMDETRAPVLDPGARKTRTGYFWALAHDERPWGGTAPPAVAFSYAPGRGGQHAERILQGFTGILQLDGYAGYNRLLAPDRRIRLAYCWAHARRKLIEIIRMGPAPIAEEGLRLIRTLYAIEAETPDGSFLKLAILRSCGICA